MQRIGPHIELGEEFGLDDIKSKYAVQGFSKDKPKVGVRWHIAALKELVFVQTGPLSIDLLALQVAADRQHEPAVAVVGALIIVFFGRAAELAHHEHQRMFQMLTAEVFHECPE